MTVDIYLKCYSNECYIANIDARKSSTPVPNFGTAAPHASAATHETPWHPGLSPTVIRYEVTTIYRPNNLIQTFR